jgi:hypothetical protein
MTWIPTKIFTGFLIKRIEGIMETQKYLKEELKPANYGLLTSVLTYMLHAVGSTPTLIPAYTREALRSLHMNMIAHRFGMFFIQELDLTKVCKYVYSMSNTLINT